MTLALFVALGIGFVVRGFVGSYASQKGANLATKQDVSQITSQIEGVKAEVQTLAKLRTDYEQQRREWLLSFYDSAVEMLHEKLGVNFGEMPFDEGRALFEFQQSFRSLVGQLVKKYQRLVVYFEPDDPLLTTAEQTLRAALQAERTFSQRFPALKSTLIEEAAAYRSADQALSREAARRTDAASRSYWAKMEPTAGEFAGALQAYLSHLNRFLKGRESRS